jgi:putative membrane protein
MPFLIRLLVNAAALWVATRLVTGVTYAGALLPLIGVALIFGALNAVIRPILKFFTFPLFILTFGLFALVLNAMMLMMTSRIAGRMGLGFHVAGFGAAFMGALVVSLVSTVLSILVNEGEPSRLTTDD